MCTRLTEEKMARLFSTFRPFSEHLNKWEDEALPDKYDHNCFEYSGQPTAEEFKAALAYPKSKNVNYIKLTGRMPLSDCFGLDGGSTLTMILRACDRDWQINTEVYFATPTVEELEEIEVKHYGELYGEDFSRRNIRRLYDKYSYYGAYWGRKLVGAVYSYTDRENGFTCIDGLIVDEKYRKRYIGTALIAHIRDSFQNTSVFLHADDDDTPKEMYLKLGFEVADRSYEYTCTDI